MLNYHFINLNGQKEKFYADNQFRKIIMKFNKKKIKLFANAKSKILLYKTIVINVMFFKKYKKMLVQVTKATWHKNCHLIFHIYYHFIFIVKLI